VAPLLEAVAAFPAEALADVAALPAVVPVAASWEREVTILS
jgi:hypothetical protein